MSHNFSHRKTTWISVSILKYIYKYYCKYYHVENLLNHFDIVVYFVIHLVCIIHQLSY